MFRRVFTLFFLAAFVSACASTPVSQKAAYKPKSFVTPYEYFSKAKPAVATEQDKRVIQRTATVQSIGEETKEDHTQAIIIGTLVGISVIGGTVAGILLAK
ncbi:MAG TPA: hypothetical protein DF383_13770 [Deltaproteobacteria bacterium]|nr:hypothetical protein [Deltaproteobacteria bacterium]